MTAVMTALTAAVSTPVTAPVTAPGWGTVLSTWHPTWAAEIVATALAAAYLRTALGTSGWPVVRTVSFVAALAVAVVTVDSGISVYAPQSFAVHMVMHLLLIMVVPALWVAGRPLELLTRALPVRRAAALDRLRASAPARALTFPATVLVVYGLVVALTHLTDFPAAVATHPALHVLEQLLYLGAGLLFFHTALGLDRRPERPAYVARFVLMLISMGVDTLVGVVLMTAPATLLPVFTLDDVHLGGAIMWSIGDGLMMVIMVALSWRWVTDSSARVDFGPWLESARRSAFAAQVGADEGPGGSDTDIDDSDEALAAYNRMLARLDERERGR